MNHSYFHFLAVQLRKSNRLLFANVYKCLQAFTKVFTVILQFRSFTEVLQKYLQIFTIGRDWYKDQPFNSTAEAGKERHNNG